MKHFICWLLYGHIWEKCQTVFLDEDEVEWVKTMYVCKNCGKILNH
jgi:hypothetical protein